MELQDFIHTGKDIAYTDLPSMEFFRSYPTTRDNKAFLAALKVYQGIDKTSLASIDSRILLLKFLKTHLTEGRITTKLLNDVIDRKTHHLEELKHLFEIGVLRDEPEVYNKEIESAFRSKVVGHLYLKNSQVYDAVNNVMLGNYVLEAIDPSHRFNLTSFLDKWKGSCSKIPFFLYLEDQCGYDLIPQVHYYSDDELALRKLSFKEGRLVDSQGKPITTNPKVEYLFVLDTDGNLYGTESSRSVKHTSLSRARPLIAAGSLEVNKGQVTQIGLDSGHYFPSLNTLFPLLSLFRGNDMKIKDDTRVIYHVDYQKYVTTVKGVERC